MERLDPTRGEFVMEAEVEDAQATRVYERVVAEKPLTRDVAPRAFVDVQRRTRSGCIRAVKTRAVPFDGPKLFVCVHDESSQVLAAT